MSFWPKTSDAAAQPAPAGTAPSPLNFSTVSPPPGVASPAAAPTDATQLSPDQKKDATIASKLLMAGFGEIVSVLVRSNDYRSRPISTLEDIAIPAVMTGQFSLAQAQSSENGLTVPIGVVLWARVSPEVHQRLEANIAEPVKLKTPEWRGGSIVWIVDAVGEQKVIEAMLTRLIDTEWKGQPVHMRARTKDGAFRVGTLGRPAGGVRLAGHFA